MKRIRCFSILLVVGAALCTSSLSAVELEFQPGTKKDATKTEIDPYFLVHAVHGGVFRPLALGLSNEETVRALAFIKENISFASPNTIVVKKFRGTNDLRLGFALLKAGDSTLFLVFTNFDPKTGEVKDGPINERFGRSFLVRNSRLVGDDENDTDGKMEIEFKAKRNHLSLANLYLLDGKPEHEALVMPLLVKIEGDILAKPIEKFFAFLTRGQIALIHKDFAKAVFVAAEGDKRLAALKPGPDRETAQEVMKLYREEFTLTQMLVQVKAGNSKSEGGR